MKRIGDPQSEEELQAFLGALYTAVQKSEAFLPAALIAQRTAERFCGFHAIRTLSPR
ncbi:hypothetical protein ACSYE6_31180 [Pseudomonas aeruginosa]